MFFVRKSKMNINEKLINDIVKVYFSYLNSNNIKLSGFEVSDLLRFSICNLLGLQSNGQTENVRKYTMGVVEAIYPIVYKFDLQNKSLEYKQGILEACVHSMEMSRKKAGV